MIKEILLILAGFIFLVKGADFLVKSASSIAKKLGLSEMIIGLTIVAIGTSLPEIFITITSSLNGYADLIIGNVIGSCICNLLFVVGITTLIKNIKFDKRIVKVHLPIEIAVSILLIILLNIQKVGENQTITRTQGAILIIITIAYLIYTIYEEKRLKNEKIENEILEEVKQKENYSMPIILIYTILGIVGLKFGSDFVVDNSVLIAQRLGLSEQIIGMTIVAVGTALPEIITGIIAAKKDETDLLIGNITGSNILNICLLIGLGATINPLITTTNFNVSLLFLIISSIFIQIIAIKNKRNEINRKVGIILIGIYIMYILCMI